MSKFADSSQLDEHPLDVSRLRKTLRRLVGELVDSGASGQILIDLGAAPRKIDCEGYEYLDEFFVVETTLSQVGS